MTFSSVIMSRSYGVSFGCLTSTHLYAHRTCTVCRYAVHRTPCGRNIVHNGIQWPSTQLVLGPPLSVAHTLNGTFLSCQDVVILRWQFVFLCNIFIYSFHFGFILCAMCNVLFGLFAVRLLYIPWRGWFFVIFHRNERHVIRNICSYQFIFILDFFLFWSGFFTIPFVFARFFIFASM